MRRFLSFYILLGVIISVAGCGSDQELVREDSEYHPLKIGLYSIFEIDETIYSVSDPPLELQYELMTEIVDSFPNDEGRYTYVMYRYTRSNADQAWQYLDTWSVRQNNIRTVVSEENKDFIKMVFPVSEGRTWNGNAFNSLGAEEYKLMNARKPTVVGALPFDDSIEVIQKNLDDIVVRTDIRREMYARGVGLVLREVTTLNYCDFQQCQSLGVIETGVVYSQRIIEHGIK